MSRALPDSLQYRVRSLCFCVCSVLLSFGISLEGVIPTNFGIKLDSAFVINIEQSG